MVQQERWVTFDEIAVTIDEEEEEEKLSLCDLPMISDDIVEEEKKRDEDNAEAADDFDFEFLSKDDEMCAADDVFCGGQILPLRPSVSSECGLLPPSRSGSVSESMERCSSAAWSTTSRSASSSRSSRSSGGCISRSPSSSSFSNNFYAHPSPTPRVRRAGAGGGRRRSTGSPPPGWALLRLGVAKAPQIELGDLRSRRGSGKKAAAVPPLPQKEAKKEMTVVMRLLGGGFGCKCSLDAVVEESLIAKKKERPLKKGESSCGRSRIFEWLDDLSAGKASSTSTE